MPTLAIVILIVFSAVLAGVIAVRPSITATSAGKILAFGVQNEMQRSESTAFCLFLERRKLMKAGDSMGRRLRISGILVILGLLIEALCLVWSRPIAFVVLVCVGGGLIGLGVLFFLDSLVSAGPRVTGSSSVDRDK